MSTYTDLHCRLKENLTILRKPGSKDDGLSPQKVILINPENQFYGSFNGEMNITGGTLSNLDFVGGTVTGTAIKDAKFYNGNEVIDIGAMASNISKNEQAIDELKVDVEELSGKQADAEAAAKEQLEEARAELSGLVESEVGAVGERVDKLSGDVKTISSDLEKLEEDVDGLSASSAGCLVYKDKLSLNDQNTTLSSWFHSCCLLGDTKLRKGWMYKISLGNNIQYLEIDVNGNGSITVGDGDFIVIDSKSKDEIALSAITLDNIVVLDCQDVDNVKTGVFEQISSDLNSKIISTQKDVKTISTETIPELKTLVEDVSSNAQKLVENVSNDITSLAFQNDNAISSALSIQVGKDFVYLSNLLSSYSDDLCKSLSNTVDSTYLHLSGGTITGNLKVNKRLDVDSELVVTDGLTAFSKGNDGQKSEFRLESNKAELKSSGTLGLSASENIVMHSNANIVLDNELSTIKVKVGDSQKSLADLSNELVKNTDEKILTNCNAISTDAHEYADKLSGKINDEYVHRSGDIVTGDLLANFIGSSKTFLGELSVNANDNVVVATKDDIILTADRISLSTLEDQIDLNGKSLGTILKETVSPYTETSGLVDFITKNKSEIRYLSTGDFGFEYDPDTNGLNLKIDDETLSIDVADLFNGRIIENVFYDSTSNNLKITFKTSDNSKPSIVEINVKDLFSGGFINSGKRISIDKDKENGKLTINVDEQFIKIVETNKNDIKNLKKWQASTNTSINTLDSNINKNANDIENHQLSIGQFQDYIISLSTPVVGIIPSITSDIHELSTQRYEKFEFGGVVGEDFSLSSGPYNDIGTFMDIQKADDKSNIIKNNTWYLVKYNPGIDLSARIKIKNGDNSIELGDGDQIIVHEKGSTGNPPPAQLDTSALNIFTPNNSQRGNVYIIKAGVSRYEYEDEVNRRNKLETELCGILYDFANDSFVSQLNNDSKISNVISVVVKMRDTLLNAFSKISSDLLTSF